MDSDFKEASDGIHEDGWFVQGAKRFMRHNETGDLGYCVMNRAGEEGVMLDRPNQRIVQTNIRGKWSDEPNAQKMHMPQLARICFAADKQLCTAMGDFKRAKRDWASLSDTERFLWTHTGPQNSTVRYALWTAIRDALLPETLVEGS